MRIAGVWVGWGLGDNSATDFTVKNAKALMRRKFASYAGNLADTNTFDSQMFSVVVEMQNRYVADGKLTTGKFIVGVLDLPTEIAMGYKKPQVVLPIVITVEGHMSDMMVGPCAYVASTLESEGRCHWQPTGYDDTALPFDNADGVRAFLANITNTTTTAGHPFPLGTPWEFMGFSQGSIVVCQAWLHSLANAAPGSFLAQRVKDLRRVITFGNPYREKDRVAEWVPDPPKPGTQGISDERMVNTPSWWKDHSRTGDLYAENPDSEVGLDRTAIYKIVSDNSWVGGPAAIFTRVMAILENPTPEIVIAVQAIIGGVLFVFNMDPHGGYNLDPALNYMRDGLVA